MTGRFAPTPSGRLHLGNILCAMLAWLSVRSRGGRFLLRIEDVDMPRCPRELTELCVSDLRRLGFDWDEPPLLQSERTGLYEAALSRLEEQGAVYPCFCTRKELLAVRAPNQGDTQVVYPGTCRSLTPEQRDRLSRLRSPALRLRVPEEEIAFTDGLQGPYREELALACGDFVLRRSDGLFGYQLAVVVDDGAQGVTEVVRGRDILSATPRQIYLQRLLGLPRPDYIHIPLLTDAQGRRLAKRDRDLDLTALLQRFTPEQLLGMLAFSAGLLPEPEPMSLYRLIPYFSWEKVPRETLRLPELLTRDA